MNNIVYIHQSAELYGSDKTLLYLVSEMKQKGFNPIVVLPSHGPLYDELEKNEIEIIIAPVIKISRKMFSFFNLISLPFQVYRSFRCIRKNLKGREIHRVHSNTLAVLTGALYAKRYGIKHLWHVHEIISHPKLYSNLYPKIVDFFSDTVVYNSKATQEFMVQKRPKLLSKSHVVLNGFDRISPKISATERHDFRTQYFKASDDEIVIALVGRISRWKGQQLLLNAFRLLEKEVLKVKLVFVGSTPPNQEVFLQALEEKIKEYHLEDKVTIVPFQKEVWKIWDSIDIAVIPSTEPEPFGLVAIEAMLACKPVIGANHGGLVEIIQNNKTGLLVAPNNEEALKKALLLLVSNKELRNTMGVEGLERAITVFSLKNYIDQFAVLYR